MFDSRAVMFNNRPIAATSAIWVSSQFEQDSGVQAPSETLGVFLCLGILPMAVYKGRPSGLPVLAVGVRRSANPLYTVTILIDSEWCRFGLNQIENTNMISIPFPVDAVNLRVSRALALVRLLQISVEHSDSFQIHREDAQHILWLVEIVLQEAQAASDAWADARVGGL